MEAIERHKLSAKDAIEKPAGGAPDWRATRFTAAAEAGIRIVRSRCSRCRDRFSLLFAPRSRRSASGPETDGPILEDLARKVPFVS